MNKKYSALLISLLVIVGLYFLGIKFYQSSLIEDLKNISNQNLKEFAPDYSPRFGNKDAKVVITEFLDPECESCRYFYPKVKELLKLYDGKVQLVIRYAAYHKNSVHAIKVLEASRKQNKFAESLDTMFKNQPDWANHHNPKPNRVYKYLASVGLDIDQLKKDMEDPSIIQIISKDASSMKKLNVRGTPTFFINGKPLSKFGIGELYDFVTKEVNLQYP